MHKRFLATATGLALSAIALAGCASMGSGTGSSSSPPASSAPASSAAPPATSSASPASAGSVLGTRTTSLGTILVDSRGRSVYLYTADTPNAGASTCYGQCAATWPPVTTNSASPAVTGVAGRIGTITRTGGVRQVTVNGWPLYTYAGDAKAGATNGQGLDGSWYVLSPAGKRITTTASVNSSY